MVEHQLIKLLLNKEAFTKLSPHVYEKVLSSEIRNLYRAITQAHEKYDHDISLEELEVFYFSINTLSESKKELTKKVLEKIKEEEPISLDVLKDVVIRLSKQKVAQEAVELLSPIVLGKEEDFTAVYNLLEKKSFEREIENIQPVTNDIGELVSLSMPENRFAFALPTLEEKVLGAGRGNFVIVFGRPEIGKSSYVADNNIGYLKQGLKVSYFGNEEPGWKIMLNHIRSTTGLSDKELQDNYKKGIKTYEEWDEIKENFMLFDGVGMHVSDIDNHIKSTKSDVAVLDQIDKILVTEKFNQEHLRLRGTYVQARELAKRNDMLVIGVSQASIDAEDRRFVTFSMLDGSKTGKAGEADIIIGIGKSEQDGPFIRHLTVSKNKISGWHGHISCQFLTDICRVEV